MVKISLTSGTLDGLISSPKIEAAKIGGLHF